MCLVLARSSNDWRSQEFSQKGSSSERRCQRNWGKSQARARILKRGCRLSSPLRASRSTNCHNGRHDFMAAVLRTSFLTISTTTSVLQRSVPAFISSWLSVAFPAICWQTGCACSRLTLMTFRVYRSSYLPTALPCWTPPLWTRTHGFRGSTIVRPTRRCLRWLQWDSCSNGLSRGDSTS